MAFILPDQEFLSQRVQMSSHKGALPSGRILAFMISHGMTFFYPSVSTFMIASKLYQSRAVETSAAAPSATVAAGAPGGDEHHHPLGRCGGQHIHGDGQHSPAGWLSRRPAGGAFRQAAPLSWPHGWGKLSFNPSNWSLNAIFPSDRPYFAPNMAQNCGGTSEK